MELILNKDNNNVFTFNEEIGSQVWQPEPITRFRFKNPVENTYIKERLKANYPTAGIVFNDTVYIGTSDGFICTEEKKIQRIPDLFVDKELFLAEHVFKDEKERENFGNILAGNYQELFFENARGSLDELFKFKEEYSQVVSQSQGIDRYLEGKLKIIGFAVNGYDARGEPLSLYDGSLLGITKTETGELVNDLIPHALYQVNKSFAGFVPAGYPPTPTRKIKIENGLEKAILTHCVDYKSLWSLDGGIRMVDKICPRDGSGYKAALFATDCETIAISHGNHPYYKLDIFKYTEGVGIQKVKSIDLDPDKLPTRLFVAGGQVLGDYGNVITNFSTGKNIFKPKEGKLTSISDSGLLCTSQDKDITYFNHVFSDEQRSWVKGHYTFLQSAPQ